MKDPSYIKNYYIGNPEHGESYVTILGSRDPEITEKRPSPRDYELFATVTLKGVPQLRLAQAMAAFYEIIMRQGHDTEVKIDASLWYAHSSADDDNDSDSDSD